MNNQPISKKMHQSNGHLLVHSIFHTIQGEGPFCGTPAVFIRLAGCNLQCPACDTDYTSTQCLTGPITILDLVKEQASSGLVVITGGEPFRQNLVPLLNVLTDAGYFVQIETNGTLEPADYPYNKITDIRIGVFVVCSPKTGKVHPKIYDIACCLKYVVAYDAIREEDGLPLTALDHPSFPYVARPLKDWARPVYVQPLDSKDEKVNSLHLKAAIKSCMTHGYILQLQIHKLINME